MNRSGMSVRVSTSMNGDGFVHIKKEKEKGEIYFREGTFILLLLAESCQISLLLVHYIFIGLKMETRDTIPWDSYGAKVKKPLP